MLSAPMIRRRTSPPVIVLYGEDVVNTDSTASWSIGATGWVTAIFGPVGNYQWVTNGTPSDYEVRATVNSGGVSSGSAATGSWLAMTSSRTWQRTSPGSPSLTIEIRRVSDSVVVASATVTITYELGGG